MIQISIKNIKGFGEPPTTFELNLLPKKINIIFAPNGSGKTSLATAFKSLRPKKLDVKPIDKFHKDETLKSELSIKADDRTYVADETKNEIKEFFIPFVITSRTTVATSHQNVGGRYAYTYGYLDIEKAIVIEKVPPRPTLHYSIKEFQKGFGKNGKVLKNHKILFNDINFLKSIIKVDDYLNKFHRAKKRVNLIEEIKAEINNLNGTAENIINNIDDTWFDNLMNEEIFQEIINPLIENVGNTPWEKFEFFFQLLLFWERNKNEIKNAIKYDDYLQLKRRYEHNISLLNSTWKNIVVEEENKQLVIKFPHADEISNGQRDVLTFCIELIKFQSQIAEGKKYLLIIDEVFDYLDDANVITAQYFISKILKRNPNNIFPCILTHLNPYTFRNYIFKKKMVNFLFLKNSAPHSTKAMMTFISFREAVKKQTGENGESGMELYKDLSNYLFHYNPQTIDLKSRFRNFNTSQHFKPNFGKTDYFLKFLVEHINKYLNEEEEYDPYAVSIGLRRRVEKLVYDKLPTEEDKNTFLNGENCKLTNEKFEFASEIGIDIPDVFFIVNAIHNEASHVYSNQNQNDEEYIEKAMVYKLQNKTIFDIIKKLFEWKGEPLDSEIIK